MGDDEAPKAYLKARRWPQGVRCPRCGNPAVYDLPSRKWHWQCEKCAPDGYRFFRDRRDDLREHQQAAAPVVQGRPPDDDQQKGDQRTPNSAADGLRLLQNGAQHVPQNPRRDDAAAREAWRHCRGRRNLRRRRRQKPPLGQKERQHGATRCRSSVPYSARAMSWPAFCVTLPRRLRSHDSSRRRFPTRLACSRPTHGPDTKACRLHIRTASVDHHKHQYVVGAVHTNTIEGFWSIFKRGVVGTFHKVSAKYLPLYVAEFQFRYNNRSNGDIFGAVVSGC